jgi:hypothetical protein
MVGFSGLRGDGRVGRVERVEDVGRGRRRAARPLILIDASRQRHKLSPMPIPRRVLVTVLASVAGAVASSGGCDRAGDAPRPDSVVPVPSVVAAVDSPGPPASSGWDPGAGRVLLVAARPDAAIIVFPEVQGEHAAAELQFDTAAVRGSAATLVDRTGATVTTTLGEATTPGEDEECVGWPLLRVASPSGATTPWTVGFVGRGRAAPIPLDSVGSLSAADSAGLVAEVARLASAIPTRDRRLRGLPFFVQDVRRFRAAPGVEALVAHVIRRVHQEANPLEERTLLIAERDSVEPPVQGAKRYTLAFHQRAVDHEETLEGSEVLAAFTRQPGSQAMLVVARESEGGVRYSILQRGGVRQWRVKWTSALVRC